MVTSKASFYIRNAYIQVIEKNSEEETSDKLQYQPQGYEVDDEKFLFQKNLKGSVKSTISNSIRSVVVREPSNNFIILGDESYISNSIYDKSKFGFSAEDLRKNLKKDSKFLHGAYVNFPIPSTASNSSLNTLVRPNSIPMMYNINTNSSHTKPSFDIETDEHISKEVKS